jgi:hypothetical protein
VLARIQADVFAALEEFGIPYTVLEFPRFATDAAYTHDALAPIVPDASIDDMRQALERVVRPEMIHESPLSRRERLRTWRSTVWMTLVRFPVAAIRRRLDPEGTEERLRAGVAAARQRDAALHQRDLAARAEGTPHQETQ